MVHLDPGSEPSHEIERANSRAQGQGYGGLADGQSGGHREQHSKHLHTQQWTVRSRRVVAVAIPMPYANGVCAIIPLHNDNGHMGLPSRSSALCLADVPCALCLVPSNP